MRTSILKNVRTALREHAVPSDAVVLQRFFKTGPGEYGEGDRFLGIRVPATRRIAREYQDLPTTDVLALIQSEIHEERLLALIILVQKYKEGTPAEQSQIYRIYLDQTRHINNWDLVDASAAHIVGAYLENRSRKPLYKLARSASIWERRIAIMSTFHFIKNDEYDETLTMAETLVSDKEDLIHKAVGWMLREVGKRDKNTEEAFLKKHYRNMPRTMLRYAIEQFPEDTRQQYLRGTMK
ncbi:MAG: DNA alkylation repair protein [Candidatus Marinimicrobia bacterium]|nr:DNA alkylation repair protein [Candidatus Neomarinimicrobiota bacterium]